MLRHPTCLVCAVRACLAGLLACCVAIQQGCHHKSGQSLCIWQLPGHADISVPAVAQESAFGNCLGTQIAGGRQGQGLIPVDLNVCPPGLSSKGS